jgi:creatinine amidohydrolase/Fe(II)-dependent formamide hydrolase-like protein
MAFTSRRLPVSLSGQIKEVYTMAVKKWGQLTPRQIAHLDKDKTVVVFPLGTMGSLDEMTRLWADLRVVEGEAKEVAVAIADGGGPLAEYGAVLLPALWMGVEPGPDQPGTIALSLETFGCVVKAICFNLRKQGIKYIVLVVRDDDVHSAAQSLADRLNRDEPQPWVAVYNPKDRLPLATWGGDVCRALAALLGHDPAKCEE